MPTHRIRLHSGFAPKGRRLGAGAAVWRKLTQVWVKKNQNNARETEPFWSWRPFWAKRPLPKFGRLVNAAQRAQFGAPQARGFGILGLKGQIWRSGQVWDDGEGGGSKRGFQRLSLSVAVSEYTKASKGSEFSHRLGVGAPYWARAHTKKLVSGPMLICYSERAQSVGPARPTSAPSWDGHNACHMARPAPLLIALTLARQLGSETRYVRVVRGSGTRGQSSLIQH